MYVIPEAGDSAVPTLAEITSALSFALDLTEGAVPGHANRSCLLGMRIGRELGLGADELTDLYYASLLKDSGCSSNAARMCQIIGGDDRVVKAAVKLEDWTRPHRLKLSTLKMMWHVVLPGVQPIERAKRILRIGMTQHANNALMISLRCERGAEIMRKLGGREASATAVRSLDEHWDGAGYPDRLKGDQISLLARIMAVAQHLDVFAQERGTEEALRVLRERSKRWFDPRLVKSLEALHRRGRLWEECMPYRGESLRQLEGRTRKAILELAPAQHRVLTASDINLVCEAFAEVVDAKSPFTFQHSIGVAAVADVMTRQMGLGTERMLTVHRAALLHDLGKLRVPNSILDKGGRLNDAEWQMVKEHPGLSREILRRVRAFWVMAEIAGDHHEKLDGSGYPFGKQGEQLSLETRIVTVADIFGALTENRPYRPGRTAEEALRLMEREAPRRLDGDCLQALRGGLAAADLLAAARPANGSESVAEMIDSLTSSASPAASLTQVV